MNLQNALFNWLQMEVVCDARPQDQAALETLEFFAQILSEDHKLDHYTIDRSDAEFYIVNYETDGKADVQKFERQAAEQLLNDINSNPKYN